MDTHPMLERHIALFNNGVRTGDFGPFVSLFTDDAEMRFEGIPVGPFRGRAAIAEAYREQPPDDTIRLLRRRIQAGEILAEFAWERTPGERGGDLVITLDGNEIATLTIVYGGSDHRWR